MSSPGIPALRTNDDSVRNDFLAARAAVRKPTDDWMRAAAQGASSAPAAAPGAGEAALNSQSTATGAAPSAPAASPASSMPKAAAPNSTMPLGLSIEQAVRNWGAGVAQRARDLVMAKPQDRDTTLGAAVQGGLAGIGPEIGKEFVDGLRAAKRDTLPANLQELQDSLDTPILGTKPIFDALGALFSPLTGALTSAVGRPVEEQTGIRRDLVGNVLAGVVPLGGVSRLLEMAGGAREAVLTHTAGAAVEAKTGIPKAVTGKVLETTQGQIERTAAGPAPSTAAAPSSALTAAPKEGSEEGTEIPRPFDIAGAEPGKPGATLKVTPALRQQAGDYLAGKIPDSPIQASLEGLARDPDMNKTIADVARFIPKDAVKPDDVLRMNAYSLGLTPEEVMGTGLGKLPSDERGLAWNMLINSGAQQLRDLAVKAVGDNTPEANEAFVRAFTLQNKLEGDWMGAGTEMGRAFRARQLAEGARSDFSDMVRDIIANTGSDNIEELKAKIASLDDPKKVPGFLGTLRRFGGRDGLLYGWYNFLLSNPATIVKKLASDATVATWNVATRQAAASFGSGAVSQGEVAALFHGYVGSMGDAFRAAGKALKAGQSQFLGDYQTMDGETQTRLSRLLHGDAIAPGEPTPTGAAINYLRMALPTSWIGAADDFAKVANYRAELHSLAWRQAVKQANSPDGVQTLYNALITTPSQGLHEQAVAAALTNTFQEPLDGLAASIQSVADKINVRPLGARLEIPLGRIIMPFVKVPANIVKFAYRNSPMPLAFPSAAFKAEIAAGGASRDLAYARVGLGTAASLTALGLVVNGQMTGRGPSDPQMQAAWRRAGNEPYSFKVGGKWYEYNRVEPLGTILGSVADTANLLQYAHDEDAAAATWSLVFGVGNTLLSKTYMQGFANFLEAVHDPSGDGARYADGLVGSLVVPQGLDAIVRQTDDFARAHYSMMDQIAARTPGMSTTLPAQQDIWGRDIKREDGFLLGRALSPIAEAPDTAEPADKWIWENREAFPQGPEGRLGLTKPGQVQSYESGRGVSAQVKFTPQQLHSFRALAGDGLKDPQTGLGALGTLNALVKGDYPDADVQARWNGASAPARALMVLSAVNKFKAAAKQQMARQNPDIADAVQSGFAARKQALQPANNVAMPQLGAAP